MNSKYFYYFCLVSRDDLANTMLSKHDYKTRNHKICKTIIIMIKKNQNLLNQCQIFFGILSKYNFYLFYFILIDLKYFKNIKI